MKKFRYTDDTTLVAENKGTKELLDEGERGDCKSCLKTQHSKKMKIMTFGPIISWQIHGGKKTETVIDFVFLCSKITSDMTAAMKLKDTCPLEGKL